MPYMHGLELATHVKSTSPLPILMQTGDVQWSREIAKEGCVDAVLNKPYDMKDLRQAIYSVLENSQ